MKSESDAMSTHNETISLTALRLLPYSLIIRTIASIGMMVILIVSMKLNNGVIKEADVINPDFEVMVVIILIGYIIGIYCLSGIRRISPKIRYSLNALAAVTVIACVVLAMSCFSIYLFYDGKIEDPNIFKEVIDLCFFALVIVESFAVKLLMEGLADYLDTKNAARDAARNKRLGKVYLYMNILMMMALAISVMLHKQIAIYMLMIICPVWTILLTAISAAASKSVYIIWRRSTSGAE